VISLDFRSYKAQIDSLMNRYRELPRHIARKHLKAAMNRSLAGAKPALRAVTPKARPRNRRNAIARDAGGRFVKGSGKKLRLRGGDLRRAVVTKSKWVGKARDGFVVGVVGYRGGLQSRKAIWLEYGTTKMRARELIPPFIQSYGRPQAKTLAMEMKKALKAAVREMASGRNPGRR
jgi:hypothetical protein